MASVGGMFADHLMGALTDHLNLEVLTVLLEFFAAQDTQGPAEYLAPIVEVR